MLKYAAMRLWQLVPTLLLMSVIVYIVLYLLPGDPVMIMMSGQVFDATPERIEEIRQEMGLDDPLYVQYGRFLLGAVQGDLGTSYRSNRPVTEALMEQFPATLQLAFISTLVGLVIGLVLGIIAAIRQHTWLDTSSMVVSLLFVSTPVFWVGLMLILAFSFELRWFPSSGSIGWRTLVLPTLTLGLGSAGMIARLTRSGLIETMSQDYIVTARAKGLSKWLIIYRHAMKNTMIPVLTMVGLQFGAMISGAVVTETVFSRPGIGRLTVDAIMTKDFALVQGAVLLTATSYMLVNFLVDILYTWFDPRIRRG